MLENCGIKLPAFTTRLEWITFSVERYIHFNSASSLQLVKAWLTPDADRLQCNLIFSFQVIPYDLLGVDHVDRVADTANGSGRKLDPQPGGSNLLIVLTGDDRRVSLPKLRQYPW